EPQFPVRDGERPREVGEAAQFVGTAEILRWRCADLLVEQPRPPLRDVGAHDLSSSTEWGRSTTPPVVRTAWTYSDRRSSRRSSAFAPEPARATDGVSL